MAAGEQSFSVLQLPAGQGETVTISSGRLCCRASSSSSRGRPALGWQSRAGLFQLLTYAVRQAAAKSGLLMGGRQGWYF